jgi:hypothetical protein
MLIFVPFWAGDLLDFLKSTLCFFGGLQLPRTTLCDHLILLLRLSEVNQSFLSNLQLFSKDSHQDDGIDAITSRSYLFKGFFIA